MRIITLCVITKDSSLSPYVTVHADRDGARVALLDQHCCDLVDDDAQEQALAAMTLDALKEWAENEGDLRVEIDEHDLALPLAVLHARDPDSETDDEAQLRITATRSAGQDGAVLVFIDTEGFEPNGSDGGPGLRVLVNDADVTECASHDFRGYVPGDDEERPAAARTLTVPVSALRYVESDGPGMRRLLSDVEHTLTTLDECSLGRGEAPLTSAEAAALKERLAELVDSAVDRVTNLHVSLMPEEGETR